MLTSHTSRSPSLISASQSHLLQCIEHVSPEVLAVPHGPMSQANFLKGMGIDMRVDALVKAASTDERQKVIRDAALRLADPVGMGKEYQVLGITSKPTSEDRSPEVWPFVASPP